MRKFRIGLGAAVMAGVLLFSQTTAFAMDSIMDSLTDFIVGADSQDAVDLADRADTQTADDTADEAENTNTPEVGETPDLQAGRIEGPGFDTPEDALAAYVQGWIDGDVSEMMAAYAVESFVEHYDLEAMTERNRSYNPGISYLPNVSDLAFQINVETRKQEITDDIRCHYLALTRPELVLEDIYFQPIPMGEDYATAKDLLDYLYASDDSMITDGIVYEGIFYEPERFTENYLSEQNQEVLKNQALTYGAEEIRSVATAFTCGENQVLLIMDAARYDGKWYVLRAISNLSMILGLSTGMRGMVPGISDPESLFID